MTEQVTSATLSTRFVARERELAQLQTFLDHALAGHGQVCFVTGEAGAGKALSKIAQPLGRPLAHR
jgi:Cdc6-like AAA superfamily ATPase